MAKKVATSLSADEIRAITAQMEKWYESQKKVNSGLDGYIESIKLVGELKKNIATIQKEIDEIENTRLKMTSKKDKEIAQEKINALIRQKELIDAQTESIKKSIKESKKWSMAIGAAGAATLKAASNLDKIPNFITGKLGLLKGLFEMDKAIRTTVTQMGALGKQSDIVRQNIKSAAVNTISFGAGIKEIAEIQAQYTESLGRNVMLSQKSLETIAEMGKSTGLGIEGATEMATQFDKMGVSAEMAGKFTQDALDRSSAMGLNATKVMKNITQNIKMLNKYRFKEGIKGLVKMAELSAKLGVDMDFASGMAEKLFSIEGAVEMSAQLNVMGGAWAQMADPFKLMYQARNDIQGLTDNISKAAASSMSFAKDGSIQTNAEEMHRLRIVAEQTGLEYEKLVELGKTKFKFDKIDMQSAGLTDDMKTFLANTAEFKDGKAYIELESGKKLLTRLNKTDREFIQRQIDEKKTMKDRADAAVSFDEKFQNLINMVQITMLPIVEGLTKALGPLVDDLMKGKFKDDLVKLGENIGAFVEWAAKGLGSFVSTIVDTFGAQGLFYTYLVGKAALWLANGYLLAKGFMLGAGPLMRGMGGMGGRTPAPGPAGGYTKNGMPINKAPAGAAKPRMGAGARIGAGVGLGVASMGLDYGRSKMDDPESTGGKWLGVGSSALTGAGMGMMFGGPWGAAIGGVLGGAYGAYNEFVAKGEEANQNVQSMDDGIVQFNKDDKFTKVNDSTMIAGTNKNGNKDLAQVLKYGMMASSPLGLPLLGGGLMGGLLGGLMGGSGSSNKSAGTKIEFGELRITGEIKVSLPDGSNIGKDLLKSQEFRTSITRVVQSQLEKNNNGGKNSG